MARPTRPNRFVRQRRETSVVREPISGQIISAIDQAVEQRWDAALTRAVEAVGATRDERVDAVTASIRNELGTAGAVAGGTAALPGVGFATTSAAFLVELSWSTLRMADLILTIAAIHGHGRATVEERRLWVLSILTFQGGAAGMVAQLADDLADSGNRRLSPRVMRQMNSVLGRTIVSKYGARRGVAALGRAVPFGIGAVLGFGINSRAVTVTAKSANTFFTQFPISLDAIDVDGTQVRGALGRATVDGRGNQRTRGNLR